MKDLKKRNRTVFDDIDSTLEEELFPSMDSCRHMKVPIGSIDPKTKAEWAISTAGVVMLLLLWRRVRHHSDEQRAAEACLLALTMKCVDPRLLDDELV